MSVHADWQPIAQRVFAAHPSVATVSMVSRELAVAHGAADCFGSELLQASAAVPSHCVINASMLDLLGGAELRGQIESATLRGLHHAWIIVPAGGAPVASELVPAATGDRIVLASLPTADSTVAPLAIGIDAAWLLDSESGAQVFVFELVRAMAQNPAIARLVLLSDRGAVPAPLTGVAKVSGQTWAAAIASGERLDVLHRPYQPAGDTDFERYRQVARAVAVTVLDFIAYDNPAYHESPFAFRAYQRGFDTRVCQADQVLAISSHIGDRLQRQFTHRLLAPVRAIHLGTDHLDRRDEDGGDAVPPALAAITTKNYLAVLGNDFAHKNRDFAVKVFAEMCRQGYAGELVLAGFHLDAGSSFDYELESAGDYRSRVLRIGSLPSAHKTWLLRNAAAVLYPTSSEGFGLIPFEAAALGTPTAFVRFGPLAETMPDVLAATTWDVKAFAGHVFSLLGDPGGVVAAINQARQPLTWDRCAAQTIAVYRDMVRDEATWHAAVAERRAPGALTRLNETAAEYWRRAGGRVRRLSGRRADREGQR